jgi:hypothetical protein
MGSYPSLRRLPKFSEIVERISHPFVLVHRHLVSAVSKDVLRLVSLDGVHLVNKRLHAREFENQFVNDVRHSIPSYHFAPTIIATPCGTAVSSHPPNSSGFCGCRFASHSREAVYASSYPLPNRFQSALCIGFGSE